MSRTQRACASAKCAIRSESRWSGASRSSGGRTLLDLGLWGVPSFRLLDDDAAPDFCAWGQDRLWLVEQELRRRTGAPTR